MIPLAAGDDFHLDGFTREGLSAREPTPDQEQVVLHVEGDLGAGLNSAEMPLIGTDLGEDFDESIVLQPGMVLVLEPAIWEDGRGGYRSEEIVAVTDSGCVFLSDFPYTPFTPLTPSAPSTPFTPEAAAQ